LSFISLGGERYEKKEMQQQVRKRFSQLQQLDEKDGQIPWYVVNAAQTIEDVQKEINGIVEQTLEKIHGENLPVGLLWKKEGETTD
jgi:thymidylate kinase